MAVGSRFASLFLFLATQTSNVIVGNQLEDASTYAHVGCPNLAPGLGRMALGVDITKLDLFHDYTVDGEDGFTDKIIEYTCTDGKTWASPYDSKTYQIPDQIDDFSALSSGMVISEASVYSQKNEMKEAMAAEAGLDASSWWASFSASLTYKSSFQNKETIDKSVGSNKAFVSVARATFPTARFLANSSFSKYFISDIEALPAVFDSTSEEEYLQLIKSYGTHFFHRGDFGGSLSIWFAISKSLHYTMSTKELNAQVQASFLSILKAHGAYSGDTKNATEQFTSNSSHTERYFGGQANLLDSEGYKAWWPTIAGNPLLHSGSLKPITDLLGDSHPKKAELLKAVEAYQLKASLHETRTVAQLYQSFHPKYADDPTLKAALQRLSDEKITLESLTTIDREVQDHTLTPVWFGSKFKVCLNSAFQEPCCTNLGQKPGKVPISEVQTQAALDWSDDGSTEPKLFDILRSSTTFSINETVNASKQRKLDVRFAARAAVAPAWIQNTQFGLRRDYANGSTRWWLVDSPTMFADLTVDKGESFAVYIVPAPL